MNQEDRLAWIDCEMTGLDPKIDTIIEIATIVTNSNLEIIEEGPCLVIHHDAAVFERMDDWNKEHHTASGLWEKVVASTVTTEDAELQTLAFLARHVLPNQSPLCGNSVWQDRRFLVEYMPKLEAYLHYRLVDVSTIKELGKRWYKDVIFEKKQNAHRALDDIRESIDEMRFYREQLFKPVGATLG